jgi:Membrane proteins related to metalloendopeptidases
MRENKSTFANRIVGLFLVMLVFSLAVTFAPETLGGSTTGSDSDDAVIRRYKEQIKSAESAVKTAAASLQEAKDAKATAMEEKIELDMAVTAIQNKVDLQRKLIESIEAQISQTNDEIAVIQARLDETEAVFEERLIAAYEDGTIGYIEILLGANDLSDLLLRIDAVYSILEFDKKIIDSYEADKAVIVKEQLKLKAQEAELTVTMNELDADMKIAEARQAESETYIQLLSEDEDTASAVAEDAERRVAVLNGELEVRINQIQENIRLERERQAAELKRQQEEAAAAAEKLKQAKAAAEKAEADAKAAKAAEAADAANKAAADKAEADAKAAAEKVAEAEKESEAAESAKRATEAKQYLSADGDYEWPLSNSWKRISSSFGPRIGLDGENENHGAIDIPASYGSSIYASNSGTVVVAEYHYSYGNYVIIDHGDRMTTLYAHMSSTYVSVGQSVKKGDSIGGVGSTGYSDGNHLHFEVRVSGVRRDPLDYVSRP